MIRTKKNPERKNDHFQDQLVELKRNYLDFRYGNITIYKKNSTLILPKSHNLTTELESNEFFQLSQKRFSCKHNN